MAVEAARRAARGIRLCMAREKKGTTEKSAGWSKPGDDIAGQTHTPATAEGADEVSTNDEGPDVEAGAVPAESLGQSFPDIDLAIKPPYPPMEAKAVAAIPSGANWQYEPKFDGFRCIAFRKDKQVLLQSKAGQPLGRYFPEMVDALGRLESPQFVIDGEIVIG